MKKGFTWVAVGLLSVLLLSGCLEKQKPPSDNEGQKALQKHLKNNCKVLSFQKTSSKIPSWGRSRIRFCFIQYKAELTCPEMSTPQQTISGEMSFFNDSGNPWMLNEIKSQTLVKGFSVL